MGGGRRARRPWLDPRQWAIALLSVATVGVYYNSLHNEFLFDDLETIVKRQGPGGPSYIAELRTLLKGKGAYRPLRTASYAFDYAISGLDPWGYHASNIAYHALSAILVFLIAERLFDRRRPALLTALLFAVHPVQTDAVTYLSGRRDLLSGLFVLFGFYLFVRYRRTGRKAYLGLTLLLYLLAFFSKESGIILPLLCFAYDLISRIQPEKGAIGMPGFREFWVAARAAFGQARLLYLTFVVLAGGLGYYVLFVVRGTWQRAYHGGSVWFTLLTEARVVVHYLKLLILPLTLNADYSYNAFPVTTSWADPRALGAVLILSGLGYGLLRCLKARPLAAFGGAWFCIALLPVSQIIPHHEMMAEHYLYVPAVGFFLLVTAFVDPLLDHPRFSIAFTGAAALVLLLLSLRTIRRNADWKDEVTLWSKTVRTAPESARARNNLGAAYLRRGRRTLAQEQLEEALKIKPDLASARANLGKVYLDRGELALAERELTTALRLKRDDAIPRLWLGGVYVRAGRFAEAEQQFRGALHSPQLDAYAYNNLGALFAMSGRLPEAESAFWEALRRMPQLAEARENLARLRGVEGRSERPIEPMKGIIP